ncbi:hypothetical protein [Streptomyces marispadix]|uniref:Uncharacterized protein n=1 Tax=Streptomyces marispadix TaxID=2922868 RepID=A0ABS9T5Q2_9ACTN|nr:hypothetical protein [Streptomyces marispadix]MCH6163878.1 hypothetical protein [Streptomyces marispadix]
MHGGLPFIGVSVLVYGLVGAFAIARETLRRCGRRRTAVPLEAPGAGGAAAAVRGVRA